jgi:hypothetical protein
MWYLELKCGQGRHECKRETWSGYPAGGGGGEGRKRIRLKCILYHIVNYGLLEEHGDRE